MKVNIDKDKTLNNILWQCRTKLFYLNEDWKKFADSQTPEDTWNLLMNNKAKPVKKDWIKLETWLKNDTEYAPYVEYWVQGRVFNYHKPKWVVFYRWVWMWTYAKTKIHLEKNIKKYIDNIKA